MHIMTFNPHRYETVYGFHLLDDIHNLFPEILYDRHFQSPLVTFFQTRTNDLFPEEYIRNRSHYRLFQQTRRREASLFAHAPVIPVAPVPPVPVAPAFPVIPTIPVTPRRTHTVPIPSTPQRPVRNQTVQAFTFPLQGDLLGLLERNIADLLTPVVVAPTAEELAEASILSSLDPPADVVCAICQDNQSVGSEWRILRYCNHRFHRACVDTWFQQNVHCPVCRHDIREIPDSDDL